MAISTSFRGITASCSRAIRPASEKLPAVNYGAGPDDPRLLDHLTTLGFKKPVMVAGTRAAMDGGQLPRAAQRGDQSAFIEFIPGLIDGLAHAEDPDDAVTAFDRFLGALQRGGRLISLLRENRDLVALVALILGAAPRLGDMLARQPQIMDGLIDPRFFGAMPDQKELSVRLAATLKDASSYEDFLDRLRLFGQESLFLIGTRILSGTVSAQQASVAFADVAEGIVHTVHGLVTDQFAAQYGRIKGQETAILAMGRLGSREMTASSDLDLILLYDFDDGQSGFRRRTIAARRAVFCAAHPAADLGVHDADQLRRALRCRHAAAAVGPCRAGGVADQFLCRLSGTRSLDLGAHGADAGAGDFVRRRRFARKIEDIIRSVLTRPRDRRRHGGRRRRHAPGDRAGKGRGRHLGPEAMPRAVSSISISSRNICSSFTPRTKPEILSVSTLQVLDNAARLGVLPQSEAEILRSAARLYHDLTQILRLCVTGKFNPETSGENLLRVMARAGDTPDFSTLEARVRETAGRGAAGVRGVGWWWLESSAKLIGRHPRSSGFRNADQSSRARTGSGNFVRKFPGRFRRAALLFLDFLHMIAHRQNLSACFISHGNIGNQTELEGLLPDLALCRQDLTD